MDADTSEILLGLLAEADAVFTPISDLTTPEALAIIERRIDYRRRGLPIPRRGGDAAERKEAERNLNSLEKIGAVTFRRRHGRRSHWRLPDNVDWRLRRLATWSDWQEMVVVMLAIRAHADAGHVNGEYVPGWALCSPKKLQHLQELIAPALVRSLAGSWADSNGAAGYCLTDAGRKYLEDPKPPRIPWPEYQSHANDVYLAKFDDALDALRTLEPQHKNRVVIPLGCGDWPGEETRPDSIPSVFAGRGSPRTLKSMTQGL